MLNHFVAARLMKDAQLFERIDRYDGTSKPSGRGMSRPRPFDNAQDALSFAPTAVCPNYDAQMPQSG